MSKRKNLKALGGGTTHYDLELRNMKYIDLKKACIARGMPFEDVGNGDNGKLTNFFIRHYHEKKDLEKLIQYDDWLDKQYELKGLLPDDPLRKFRLSTTLSDEEQEDLTQQRDSKLKVRSLKKSFLKQEKKKKERDTKTGIFKGTKKALTYTLALEGKPLKDIILGVIEQFPDAKEKSIKIWVSRVLNKNKKKK